LRVNQPRRHGLAAGSSATSANACETIDSNTKGTENQRRWDDIVSSRDAQTAWIFHGAERVDAE
jgi:hypothetical protein